MFVDRIQATVAITIGSTTTTLVAGNVKRLELDVQPWGFTGSAEMWIVSQSSDDPDGLFQEFVGTDLATVVITVKRAFDDPDEVAQAMTLTGVVTSRSVTERVSESVAGAPVLQRLYAIRFADRARAHWSRHFPTKVYVAQTLRGLIDDHVPTGWTTSYDWAASALSHAVLAVGLGARANEASFYDFVHWLFASQNAMLHYASATDAYAFRDSAPPASGDPESIDRDLVASQDTTFPRTPRASVSVLNGYTDAATSTKALTNPDAVSGLRRDILMRSSVEADLGARAVLEGGRATGPGPVTRIAYAQFPAVPLVPPMRAKLGEGFSGALREGTASMRVIAARLLAVAERQGAGDDTDDETNRYQIDYEVRLVGASDSAAMYPAYVAPVWPLLLEGHVLSETGDTGDETYQPYTDQTTSLDQYKVKIPLFSDIQVVVPFDAGFLAGHFYFPLTKGARVLVAFDLDAARITEVLDWRTGGRLPMDAQADQLLFGKSATSQTSVSHVYEDGKPILSILRTSGTDLQTIEISDGRFYLETKDTGGS